MMYFICLVLVILQTCHLSVGKELIWSVCNSTDGSCRCGSDINEVVKCSEDGEHLWIKPCYCIYYDPAEKFSYLGNCIHTCFLCNQSNTFYKITRYSVENVALFNSEMCHTNTTHREGRFCGKCQEGYGLAAYSYQITQCMKCEEFSIRSVFKYLAVAFIPLTAFYFVVALLRINVTSSNLNGTVFVIQCIFSPVHLLILDAWTHSSVINDKKVRSALIYVFESIFGMANLDFFRSLYPNFCLHSKLNILHIISLDFIVALYPFMLIFVTYLLVKLYDRNCRLVMWAWTPFKWCLKCYQRKFTIKASLIETFATFILLSYVKILGICYVLLSPTKAYTTTGAKLNKLFVYYDANIEYFGPDHLPFAVLALIIGFVLVFLPFLLLVIYPCRCFQKCLNFLGWRFRALHVFMDAFQGSYKTEPYDLRYFSAYYLFLRFLLYLIAGTVESQFYFPVLTITIVMAAILFGIFQPYKNSAHNMQDMRIMLVLILFSLTCTVDMLAFSLYSHWVQVADLLLRTSAAITVFCLIFQFIEIFCCFKATKTVLVRLLTRMLKFKAKKGADSSSILESLERDALYPPPTGHDIINYGSLLQD